MPDFGPLSVVEWVEPSRPRRARRLQAPFTEVRFARVCDVLTSPEGHLTTIELTRNARLRHPADREAHLAAHLLVRHVAATSLGTDPDEVEIRQHCPDCNGTDHGRPHVVGHDLFVSLSHTRERVAAIASPHPCGIDVERVRPVADAVRRHVLTADELRHVDGADDPATAFTRLWVAKEAAVKAGLGTLSDAGTRPAPPLAGSGGASLGPVRHQWSGGPPDAAHVGAWVLDRR